MKLGRYISGTSAHLCKIEGDRLYDLTQAGFGTSMRGFLETFDERRGEVEAVNGQGIALADAELVAPIDDPQKFLALGMNYKEHADRARNAGVKVPDTQMWFNKQVSSIAGPRSDVELPKVSDQLDFEGELAVIIGKKCRHVDPSDVRRVIVGYAVGNDFSVRDWQHRSPTYTLGKSFDTHGPIGPWITTDDEIDDPQNLKLQTYVNGTLRQDANTDDMIYSIAEQISYITQAFTLVPGDVLLTGTPHGTGIESGTWLKAGDVVRCEIENLGAIENTVRPEA